MTDVDSCNESLLMNGEYKTLFLKLPNPVVLYDFTKLQIVEANEKAVEILNDSSFDSSKCSVRLYSGDSGKRSPLRAPASAIKQLSLQVVFESFASDQRTITEKVQKWQNVEMIPCPEESNKTFLVLSQSFSESDKVDLRSHLEKDYRFIFDHAHEAIISRSLRTSRLFFCNQNALEFYAAKSPDEIEQSKPEDVIAADYTEGLGRKEYVDKIFKKITKEGRYQREFWFKKINGEIIWAHAVWVCDKRDKNDWKVVSFLRDITVQQSSQLGLLTKNQELERSRTSMAYILDNSHEAIVLQEFDSGKVLNCNKQALALYEVLTESELTDARIYDYSIQDDSLYNNGRQFPKYVYEELLKKGRAEVKLWFRRASGKLIRLSVIAVADFRDKSDRRVITFEKDITEPYHAKLLLQEKNEELEKYIAANFYLQKFAFMASHDLQAPLSTMISFSNLLENSLKDRISDKEKKYLDIISTSGKNLRLFIDDLLSFSRFETQKTVVRPVDIKKMLSILLLELKSTIDEVDAEIEYEDLDFVVNASPIKLRQIFQNLISNALKFSRENEKVKIVIECTANDEYWNFVVRDNGIGIPQEELLHIFNLFARLHGSSKFPGNGIGLALVKKLVAQHKGQVWCQSTLGEGSSFFFNISRHLDAMVDEE